VRRSVCVDGVDVLARVREHRKEQVRVV
jgi:hypothetical protein